MIASPPRAYYKGQRDVLFVFPNGLPESSNYRVTFKNDGRTGRSSKADAKKVDDKTLSLVLPDHGQQGRVRVTVHGDRHLSMPPVEYEFVSLGRVLLDQFPRPVALAQLLGVMLLLPADEIREDGELFDSELTQCLERVPPTSLILSAIFRDSSLTAADSSANLLHLAAEFSLIQAATAVLQNEKAFPDGLKALQSVNSSGLSPIDIASSQRDWTMVEIFKSFGAQEDMQPDKKAAKTLTDKAASGGRQSRNYTGVILKKFPGLRPSKGSKSVSPDEGQGGQEDDTASLNEELKNRSTSLPQHNSKQEKSPALHRSASDRDQKPKRNWQLPGKFSKPKLKKLDEPTSHANGVTSSEGGAGGNGILSPASLSSHLSKALRYGRVVRSYNPTAFDVDYLKLQVGDIIAITSAPDTGLWSGVLNNKTFGKFAMVNVDDISKEEAEAAVMPMGGMVSRPQFPFPDKFSAALQSVVHAQAQGMPRILPEQPSEQSSDDEQQGLYEEFDPDDEDDEETNNIYDYVEDFDKPEPPLVQWDEDEPTATSSPDLRHPVDEGTMDSTTSYVVLAQADVHKHYTPDNTAEEMDYLKLKRGDIVNILCEPEGERWALVEHLGKVGRAWYSHYSVRQEGSPVHHQKPIYLQGSRTAWVDSIVPGDSIGVHIDPCDSSLRIFEVIKGNDELPPPQDLPPPPLDIAEEDYGQEYEPMDSTHLESNTIEHAKSSLKTILQQKNATNTGMSKTIYTGSPTITRPSQPQVLPKPPTNQSGNVGALAAQLGQVLSPPSHPKPSPTTHPKKVPPALPPVTKKKPQLPPGSPHQKLR